MVEWIEKSLGEIAEVTKLAGFEFTKHIKYNSDGEIIALRALNLRNGELDLTDIKRISREVSERLTRSKIYKDDILLTYTGNGYGDCAIIEDNDKYHLAPNICKIVPNNKEVFPYYLYCYIRSKAFYNQMSNNMTGSGQPTIPMKTIRLLKVPVPEMSVQINVANMIWLLNQKIRNNRAINNNLEQQAQTLFENTFCKPADFATKRISLSNLMDYAGGSQPPASEFIFSPQEGYIRFVQIRDYDTDSHITYIPVSSKNKLCEEHDIMIARYGASLGRICFGINGAYNVALAKVFPKKTFYREFLRCYLSSRTFYEGINNKGGRSAQSGFNQSDINSFEIEFPLDEAIVKNFEDIIAPMFEQRLQLKKENQYLSSLRDTLLPKLMSGEIDVSNIEL